METMRSVLLDRSLGFTVRASPVMSTVREHQDVISQPTAARMDSSIQTTGVSDFVPAGKFMFNSHLFALMLLSR
jgi:hypothetical protein